MFLQNKYYSLYMKIINRGVERNIDDYTEKHHIVPRCMGGSNEKTNIVKLTAREHFICHRLLVKCVSEKNIRAKLAYASWQLCRSGNTKDIKITSRTYQKIKETLSKEYTGRKRNKFSDETRQKMSNSRKGKPQKMTEARLKAIENLIEGNRNRPLSQEHKDKIGNHFRGKPLTEEHKTKISESHKGKKREEFSKEWRENLSNAARGKKRGPHTEETKRKISESKKESSPKGNEHPLFGKSVSEETKQKMSLTKKSKPFVTCPHCGKLGREGGNMTRYHFDNCKQNQHKMLVHEPTE